MHRAGRPEIQVTQNLRTFAALFPRAGAPGKFVVALPVKIYSAATFARLIKKELAMKKSIAVTAAVLVLVGMSYAWSAVAADKAPAEKGQLLSHSVYFALKEPTPEAKQKLVDSCKKLLSQHPGVVYFAAGTLCDEAKSPLNVRDFDVALLMVFSDHEALHTYAASADHQKFIADNATTFKGVRVFDADVDYVASPGGHAAK
jgi:hypothetical protein